MRVPVPMMSPYVVSLLIIAVCSGCQPEQPTPASKLSVIPSANLPEWPGLLIPEADRPEWLMSGATKSFEEDLPALLNWSACAGGIVEGMLLLERMNSNPATRDQEPPKVLAGLAFYGWGGAKQDYLSAISYVPYRGVDCVHVVCLDEAGNHVRFRVDENDKHKHGEYFRGIRLKAEVVPREVFISRVRSVYAPTDTIPFTLDMPAAMAITDSRGRVSNWVDITRVDVDSTRRATSDPSGKE